MNAPKLYKVTTETNRIEYIIPIAATNEDEAKECLKYCEDPIMRNETTELTLVEHPSELPDWPASCLPLALKYDLIPIAQIFYYEEAKEAWTQYVNDRGEKSDEEADDKYRAAVYKIHKKWDTERKNNANT